MKNILGLTVSLFTIPGKFKQRVPTIFCIFEWLFQYLSLFRILDPAVRENMSVACITLCIILFIFLNCIFVITICTINIKYCQGAFFSRTSIVLTVTQAWNNLLL